MGFHLGKAEKIFFGPSSYAAITFVVKRDSEKSCCIKEHLLLGTIFVKKDKTLTGKKTKKR